MVIITPKTRILDLIEAYPELEQKLFDMSPAFRKLQNPILRKTVARVTTLQQAAMVGNLPVERMVNELRRVLGQEHLDEKAEGRGQKAEGKEEEKGKREEGKGESDKNGYMLFVRGFDKGEVIEIPFVTGYWFAEEREALLFHTTGADSLREPGLFLLDLVAGSETAVFAGKEELKGVSMNKNASLIAFFKKDSIDLKPQTAIYCWSGEGMATPVVTPRDAFLQEGWEISENGRISFSDSGNRLFFGTAPVPLKRDTTLLDEDVPTLDIWHFNEPVLMTQQLYNRNRDLRRTWQAVYHRDLNKAIQLDTRELSGLRLIRSGDADLAILADNLPYAVQAMWEGSPRYDWYLVNLVTGERERIREGVRANPMVSTGGKFLYWYEEADSSWHTRNIESGREFTVTTKETVAVANELNDVPDPAGAYGVAGWLKGDEAMLLYDRFDLWRVHPENQYPPENMTLNGRKTQTVYRMINLEGSTGRGFRGGTGEGIDPEKPLWLSGHNEVTRGEGYYQGSLKRPEAPRQMLAGLYNLGSLSRAKDAEVVLYTREDFTTFPDLLVNDLKFKKEIRISDANPQQKEFIWGSAELVSWRSLDGSLLEGTLHTPEDFDPSKKYPMIVNFYEKSSQELFSHRIPEPHRSTIDYHYYTSNGYLVFNPDIYYKEGYPGEDAFNCVMPGVTALIEKGFIDEKRIGAQGHSWGGYQVAYLATRTNLFAAIESGAPVVNMISAYGGIRWGSGLSRAFQYEHAQSRIGKSIWESPLRYIENSPIFTMDKVNTPILIMHNDDDGAVPWYQGIEYFIALRRLGKPVWMLNYNEADHWPTRMQDKHDFQIRMAQFFNHYLKGEPMPDWMKEGLPAVEKGLRLGY